MGLTISQFLKINC